MNSLTRISRSFQPTAANFRALQQAHSRGLCTPSSGDAPSEEATPPSFKRKPKKVRKPDLPHVVRRTAYLRDVSRSRVAFAAEAEARAAAAAAEASAARDTSTEAAAARAEERAAKGEATHARLQVLREEQKAAREIRRVIGLRTYGERNAKIDARRLERVQGLNAVAGDWVTEGNLEEKVETLLDEWFVSSDAEAHARRGTLDRTGV